MHAGKIIRAWYLGGNLDVYHTAFVENKIKQDFTFHRFPKITGCSHWINE